MGFWPVVLNVLRNSDVVLLLVDARMPEVSRNSEIVNKVKAMGSKKLIIVFNKCDLVGRKDIDELKREYPDGFFISATTRVGIKNLKMALNEMAENWSRPSLRVGIVGYPNIGKSTLMNLFAPDARAKVSRVSGTTKKTQWVRVGRLRIIDSPGVIPFGDKKVQVGMTASKDVHKIKNPERVAIRIIEFLMNKDAEACRSQVAGRRSGYVSLLKKFYGVDGNSACGIFDEIGRKKGYLVKGGNIDENRTAIKVIDDWQKGKINFK